MQMSAFFKLAMATLAMMPFASTMSIPGSASVAKRANQPMCSSGVYVTGQLQYPANDLNKTHHWLALGYYYDRHGNPIYSLWFSNDMSTATPWTWCISDKVIFTAANDGTNANFWSGSPFYLAAANAGDSTGVAASLQVLPAQDALPADTLDLQYRVFSNLANELAVVWTNPGGSHTTLFPVANQSLSGFPLLPAGRLPSGLDSYRTFVAKLPYQTVTVDFPSTLRGVDVDDPLTRALSPPANETPAERQQRLRQEAEAQRISNQIDEAIKQDRAARKKQRVLKLLLLGQAESGKSTTLKTMQITYAPQAWAAERASWRAVIQLNLIRAVNAVLDALTDELALKPSLQPISTAEGVSGSSARSADTTAAASSILDDPGTAFATLALRLATLRHVETDLKARLGAGTDEVTDSSFVTSVAMSDDGEDERGPGMAATPFDDAMSSPSSRRLMRTLGSMKEIIIRSHKAWKEKEKERDSAWRKLVDSKSGKALDGGERGRDHATEMLAGCREDMLVLWGHPFVREVVERRKVLAELGDSAGYFLDHMGRIATHDYEPSNDDVLRARIRTLGVQEHKLVFERKSDRDDWKEWAIFDVGGSRTNRAAWLPYFSDVQAVLFLAPISTFDESLAEDKRVNRLEDSYTLWQSIVKTPLLAKATIILFMNKYDLLEKKLLSGVRVDTYMTSYGDRQNDAETFSAYLKQKFRELHMGFSPEKRPFYGYTTCVIDANATAATLASVRDSILQAHLKTASFVT